MSKFYWILGPLLIVLYTYVGYRGMVFAGTDGPSGAYVVTSGGKRSPRGVGFFIFGTGYRGGK
jgi:hypothetical protein